MRHVFWLQHQLVAALLRILVSARQSKVGRACAGWWHSIQKQRPKSKVFGQGLVEYALILMLLAIVVIGAVTMVGGKASQMFSQIGCEFDNKEHGAGGAIGNCTP